MQFWTEGIARFFYDTVVPQLEWDLKKQIALRWACIFAFVQGLSYDEGLEHITGRFKLVFAKILTEEKPLWMGEEFIERNAERLAKGCADRISAELRRLGRKIARDRTLQRMVRDAGTDNMNISPYLRQGLRDSYARKVYNMTRD
jgi:hypothetical protein